MRRTMAEHSQAGEDRDHGAITLPAIAENREAARATIHRSGFPAGHETVRLLTRAVVTASETFVDELMLQLYARGCRRVSVRGAHEGLVLTLERAAVKHGLRLLAGDPISEQSRDTHDPGAESTDTHEIPVTDRLPPRLPSAPSTTVFDVAEYILEQHGEMTSMKLQKLVYYCQAWHLAWSDEPLFRESIEAWANGPVVPA